MKLGELTTSIAKHRSRPGLGVNPEGSWTWNDKASKNHGYNWLENAKGLHSDLERARVMLFEYPSAYTGPFAVKVTIHDLSKALLELVQGIRQVCFGSTHANADLTRVSRASNDP
jgi:hypothetical protein